METMVKKCPECSGINLFWNKDKGEIICKDCGLVIEEKMVDFGQEWRDFEDGDNVSGRRTGAPMTYTKHDQGLGTEVGRTGDLYGLKNKKGAIAMARTSDPNSATSQFFINTVDNGNLDYPSFDGHGYTVFGEVVSGMDVVEKIEGVATGTKHTPHGPMQDWPKETVEITKAYLK